MDLFNSTNTEDEDQYPLTPLELSIELGLTALQYKGLIEWLEQVVKPKDKTIDETKLFRS